MGCFIGVGFISGYCCDFRADASFRIARIEFRSTVLMDSGVAETAVGSGNSGAGV